MKLGIFLVLFVCFRHNTSLWLHDLTNFPTRGIHYIQGGLWEAALCLTLYFHLPKEAKPLGGLACTIGVSEGLQMAICRLFGNPKGNICDVLSGIPIGATLVSMYALFLCCIVLDNSTCGAWTVVPLLRRVEDEWTTDLKYSNIGTFTGFPSWHQSSHTRTSGNGRTHGG